MTRDELRFCPRCAGTLAWQDAGHPPSHQPVCAVCGFVLWQNLKPSIEALIVRGDGPMTEVCLGRRTLDDGRTAWDLPGGFLNADDHLHDALRRECLREMGVDVTIGELLGAYEDDFHGSRIVSMIYVCTIAGGEPRAADIIEDVSWFAMTSLPDPASPAVGQALAELRLRKLGC